MAKNTIWMNWWKISLNIQFV